MIYKVKDIINKLDYSIKNKIPFSHIRFGDGGIKFIHSVLYNDVEQLDIICRKEGIPQYKIYDIFESWGYVARNADFIDTPEVYYTSDFWPRQKTKNKKISEKTDIKLRMWEDLYSRAEFDNCKYCNPESNYLMILKDIKPNLLDIMKNRRVCIIGIYDNLKYVLNKFNVNVIKIVPHYKEQYKNSFPMVMNKIKNEAKDYDFYIVCAGELGRIYSGYIKECGGRCVDMGYVAQFWQGEDIHPRLQEFMVRDKSNYLQLELTESGRKYINGI